MDSNAIIDYLGGKITSPKMRVYMDNVMDNMPAVSVISKIEVLGFNAPKPELELLENFFNDVLVLDLSNKIVDQTISLRRTNKMKTPDAIIAATALVYDLVLVSRNTSDFKNIKGLRVIDPHSI